MAAASVALILDDVRLQLMLDGQGYGEQILQPVSTRQFHADRRTETFRVSREIERSGLIHLSVIAS